MRYSVLFVGLIVFSGCTKSDLARPGVETTQVSFNVAGAPTVEFSVPDMMCEAACAKKVREILSEQPGVKEVKVDFPHKTAVVAVDKDAFKTDAAIAQLVDHQFTNSKVVEAPQNLAPSL